jgi:hypothetical protein
VDDTQMRVDDFLDFDDISQKAYQYRLDRKPFLIDK